MNVFRNLIIVFSFTLISTVSAQEIRLTRSESEAVFLKENLNLIAAKLEIDQANAQVLQAKLWPNPTFEIERGILWSRDEQEYFGGQISVEQLIQLAGKRRKLVALEKVAAEKIEAYFADLLRNLKFEFRNLLTEYQYFQLKQQLFQKQLEAVSNLTRAFKNQLDDGHISKGEYIRLKALELEIRKELKENTDDLHEAEKELKSLMHISPEQNLGISPDGFNRGLDLPILMSFTEILKLAKETRPDFRLLSLEKDFSEKNLAYEKSQRIPDAAFKLSYERGGQVVPDFFGLGLTFDLPFFDRNQGNIKAAKIEVERVDVLNRQREVEIENEILTVYKNLQNAIDFVQNIEPDHEETLDLLFESYTRNFMSRNLNLLEYLDFTEAYLENKEIIFEASKDLNEKIEQLNYVIGQDLIN